MTLGAEPFDSWSILSAKMAEEVGFEPTATIIAAPLFESGTLNHSDTPPGEIIPPEIVPLPALRSPRILASRCTNE